MALVTGVAVLWSAGAESARAASVRLWPSAAVVDHAVRLTDVSELAGFDMNTEAALARHVVAEAPPPGGTRVIHLEMVRSALAAAGVNLAQVTLQGAVQCEVSRPVAPAPRSAQEQVGGPGRDGDGRHVLLLGDSGRPSDASASPNLTLQQVVQDYFDAKLQKFGGVAEVSFDHRDDQILGLTSPPYAFRIDHGKGNTLGLTSLEIGVQSNGETVQTVPLVLQVALTTPIVVAKHPNNQDATVRASDVALMPMTVTRLDHVGLRDCARAVGQRAKRFIPVGTVIEPAMLEEVPLVQRGELVTLASVVGGVRVVTTAKAADSGLLGQVIRVRAVDNKRLEFDAVVVGPGAVELSPGLTARDDVHLARRDEP